MQATFNCEKETKYRKEDLCLLGGSQGRHPQKLNDSDPCWCNNVITNKFVWKCQALVL